MNIQSGLDKLDDIWLDEPDADVQLHHLEAILLAMRDGGEDKRVNKFCEDMDKVVLKVWKIEDRLARLENHPMKCGLCGEETILKQAIDHKCKPEPSSVSECNDVECKDHRWGTEITTGVEKCTKCGEPKPTPTPESSYERVIDEYDSCNATPKPSVEKCEETLHRRVEDLWKDYLDAHPDFRSTHQTAIDLVKTVKLALSKDTK
jgi:hypothetical protein